MMRAGRPMLDVDIIRRFVGVEREMTDVADRLDNRFDVMWQSIRNGVLWSVALGFRDLIEGYVDLCVVWEEDQVERLLRHFKREGEAVPKERLGPQAIVVGKKTFEYPIHRKRGGRWAIHDFVDIRFDLLVPWCFDIGFLAGEPRWLVTFGIIPFMVMVGRMDDALLMLRRLRRCEAVESGVYAVASQSTRDAPFFVHQGYCFLGIETAKDAGERLCAYWWNREEFARRLSGWRNGSNSSCAGEVRVMKGEAEERGGGGGREQADHETVGGEDGPGAGS